MKKVIKNLTLGLILTTSISGFASQSPQTTAEMEAQISVTKGHIDNFIQEIQNTNVTTDFNARDYWTTLPAFQTKIEQAMINFEAKVENEVFKKIGKLIDQYNKIHLSPIFSPAQKELLLKERKKNMISKFWFISGVYQSHIDQIYKLSIPDSFELNPKIKVFTSKKLYTHKYGKKGIEIPFSYYIGTSNSKYKSSLLFEENYISVYKVGGVDIRNRNHRTSFSISYSMFFKQNNKLGAYNNKYVTINASKMIENRFKNFPNIQKRRQAYIASQYDTKIFPELRKGCQSIICLSLKSADIQTLLSLTSKKIDRNIVFTLADGEKVTLEAKNRDITYFSKMLIRDSYPVNFPFDI